MIRFTNIDWETCIEFEDSKVRSIYIEDKKYFREVVEELIAQQNGEGGKFVLSVDDKEVSIKSKADIISDIFNVDPNNKKIMKNVISEMIESANIAFDETAEIQNKLNEYFDRFYENSLFDLNRDYEIDISNLMKIAGFYIDYEERNTLDRLVTYISAMKEYVKTELFVILNLTANLNREERIMFCETMEKKDIKVLCIESLFFRDSKSDYVNEEIFILDEDFCVL